MSNSFRDIELKRLKFPINIKGVQYEQTTFNITLTEIGNKTTLKGLTESDLIELSEQIKEYGIINTTKGVNIV